MAEKDWIRRRFSYENFDTNKIESILLFSLIWNIFEKECCGNFAKINTHCELLAGKVNLLDPNVINTVWDYFYRRYVVYGKPSESFVSFQNPRR